MGQAYSGSEAVGLEGLIARPDGPGDASEFVGQSDGGFVVSFTRLERKGPELERARMRRTPGSEQSGSSTVGQEGAQIRIAAFGDGAEVTGGA